MKEGRGAVIENEEEMHMNKIPKKEREGERALLEEEEREIERE